MSRKINAEIVADSINEFGNRITTYLLTFPRFILPELNTHRLFTRNSASSRAIPFEKMVAIVETDPFIPIAWQKDHSGMQGTEYVTDEKQIRFRHGQWLNASRKAIQCADDLHDSIIKKTSVEDPGEIISEGITKQLCNRLLEPFMWHTVLLTATEYDNFFELRCPKFHTPVSGEGFYFKSKKDCINNHSNKVNLTKLENFSYYDWQNINTSGAEIHIQALAESMWDVMNESTPKLLKAGEWHVPFGDKMNIELMSNVAPYEQTENTIIKIATARCARLSYMTFDKEINYQKDIDMHDMLKANRHLSPFEHCARTMTEEEYYTFTKGQGKYIDDEGVSYGVQYFPESANGWCNNFKGYIQYRYLLESAN